MALQGSTKTIISTSSEVVNFAAEEFYFEKLSYITYLSHLKENRAQGDFV